MKLLDWIPLEQLTWTGLSRNPSEGALDLLEKNLDKINWGCLSLNLNDCTLTFLENNIDKINWRWLSRNSSIFVEDYLLLSKQRMEILREELMATTWHPDRFTKWCLDTSDEFFEN